MRQTNSGPSCWVPVVVKPAVSGGSFSTMRVGPATLPEGEAHLRGLLRHEDVLVQAYLSSVEGHGATPT